MLRITYKAFQATADEVFTMHPYYLKEYRERWYVFGLVVEKDTVYNLALDRITAIDVTRVRYKTNNRFDPITYFKDIVGVTRPANKNVETVLLGVDSTTAPYLETRPIHHSQQVIKTEPESVIFQYTIIPNYEFVAEVLRMGEAVQLLSPSSLRELVATRLATLNSIYQR